MSFVDVFNGLQLDYYFIFNDKISPEPFIKLDAVKLYGNWDLSLDFQPSFTKHMGKEHFIYCLKQTRA